MQLFWKGILILGVLNMTASASVAAAKFELTLLPKVVTPRQEIYLRDLVAGMTPDAGIGDAYLDVYICHSPRIGYERKIDSSYVLMKLKQRDMDLSVLELKGAREIVIQRQEGVVRVGEQKQAIKKWVAERLGMDMGAFDLDFRSPLKDEHVPYGRVGLQFEGKSEELKTRNIGIYESFYVDGHFFKRVSVNFGLLVYQEVVVLKQSVEEGALFNLENVAVARRLVSVENKSHFTNLEAVLGGKAKRTLTAGTILQAADWQKRVLVHRGEQLDCKLSHKNMQMTVRLEALEDGCKGELIKLGNHIGNKTIVGRVIGERAVEVLL